MITKDEKISLTDKVALIFTTYLKQSQVLARHPFVNHLEASLITPPVIHVAAKLNGEAIPNSGIMAVGLVIAYRYLVGVTAEDVAQKIWGAVNLQCFNFTSSDLADLLTAIRPADFFCHSVELSNGEEQTAQENERQRTIQLELNCAST